MLVVSTIAELDTVVGVLTGVVSTVATDEVGVVVPVNGVEKIEVSLVGGTAGAVPQSVSVTVTVTVISARIISLHPASEESATYLER